MSVRRLRLLVVLKLDPCDVSHAFCQRALGVFGNARCTYGILRSPSCLCLHLLRSRTAGVSQYCIILRTVGWSTCTAVFRRGLSGNIGIL